MLTETSLIAQVLRESIEDLCRMRREADAQDLIGFRLSSRTRTEVRKVVRREEIPEVEVDLLLNDKIAIEVKFNSQYKDGLDQLLILRDLYGLYPALIHITKGFSAREVEALRRISKIEGFPIFIVHLKRKEVFCLG